MSLVFGIGVLVSLATGSLEERLGTAVAFGFLVFLSRLSSRVVEVRLVNRTVEIRGLFRKFSLPTQEFLDIKEVAFWHMRMDFKQHGPLYFFPNNYIAYPLVNSFEAWSQMTKLTRGEQADRFCDRVHQLMR